MRVEDHTIRTIQVILAIVTLAALVFAASEAPAQTTRTETLRWTQERANEVEGWRAYGFGHTGAYVATYPLGKPTPNAQGVYSATISLDANWILYVVIQAYNAAGVSGYSNHRLLIPPVPTFAPVPGASTPPSTPAQTP